MKLGQCPFFLLWRSLFSLAEVNTMSFLKKWILIVLFVSLPCCAIFLSVFPVIKIAYAAYHLKVPNFSSENSGATLLTHETKRRIQRHFLDYDYYIPLEDIVFLDPNGTSDDNTTLLTKMACGQGGQLAIWLPLKVRLPLFGNWIIEWCWVPEK